MKALLACAVLLPLAGCSLLNAPVRDYPDATSSDGGVPMDVPTPDTPPDAGGFDSAIDGCVPDDPSMLIEDCTDGVDNDCNGLVDCEDFDCAGTRECCAMGESSVDEAWRSPTEWTGLPAGTVARIEMMERLRFGGSAPTAFVYQFCSPLLLGATISTDFHFDGPTCAACPDYASLVLSPTNDSLTGTLMDDLRVTVDGVGTVRALQAGRELGRATMGVGTSPTVTIDVSPGTNARSIPVLFATVRVGGTVVVPDYEFLRQSRVLTDRLVCPEGPGLYVGVEGRGDLVQIERTRADTLRCANPSHFEPTTPSPIIRVTDDVMPLPSEILLPWALGGIGAPALASYNPSSMGPATTRFQLLLDGTNTPRDNEGFRHVGIGIGGAFSTNGLIDWTSRSDPDGNTLIGPPDPHPLAGEPTATAREPTIAVIVDENGRTALGAPMFGAFAEEIEIGTDRDVYGIQTFTMALPPASDETRAGLALRPADVECHSLRDPLLLPRSADGMSGFWLLFTCMPRTRTETKPSIKAVSIDSSLGSADLGTLQTVLTADVDGRYSVNGVYAPEGVARFIGTGDMATVTYRLWYLEVDEFGLTRIAMAQSESPAGTTQLFPFNRYPGNPVLQSTSPVLGDCNEDCYLEGFTAAIVGGQGVINPAGDRSATVRFLVARSVNDEMTGARYELVPLEQFWR